MDRIGSLQTTLHRGAPCPFSATGWIRPEWFEVSRAGCAAELVRGGAAVFQPLGTGTGSQPVRFAMFRRACRRTRAAASSLRRARATQAVVN